MTKFLRILVLLLLVLSPTTVFASGSNICTGTTCQESEVGVFMEGITEACGDLGDCTLNDILQVFVNIGNYVIGIIGVVVLLMYVVGGFCWLTSAGRREWVDKGKKFMMISTIGLLIVMFSYLAIQALKSALQTGDITNTTYVTCSGEDTKGDVCDANGAKCDNDTGFTCEYE